MEIERVFREVILIVSNEVKVLGVIWLFIDEFLVLEGKLRILESCIV